MNPAFNVKSTRFDALVFRLLSADSAQIAAELQAKATKYQAFGSLPLVLDASGFEQPEAIDWPKLLPLFAEHGLRLVGLRHRSRKWAETAAALGLAFIPPEGKKDPATESGQPENAATASKQPASGQETASAPASRKTVVIRTPVRTGQQVYAENADLIVLGMVSEGAEVIADGNIHVYAPLRGRALAGEAGDRSARIFVQSMQAELVSIAGIYRVFEQQLPAALHKKAVQIELQDNDRLAIAAIGAQ